MKFSFWKDEVDADRSCWMERGKAHVYFLVVLRVFFDATREADHEQIGASSIIILLFLLYDLR